MKKQLIKSTFIAVSLIGVLAGSAMALPVPEAGYSYSNADYWTPTDLTTPATGNSQFNFIFQEAAYQNSFGLYTSGGVLFEIFNGTESVGTEKTVTYWDDNGTFKLSTAWTGDTATTSWTSFSNVFGFYFQTINTGNYWFTDQSRNTVEKNIDHVLVATNVNNQVYVYLEDLANGDLDFNDKIMKGNDLAPVPEPTTMLLFGAGLAGLAAVGRRRRS